MAMKKVLALLLLPLLMSACMKVAGMEEGDLREGVQMAEKEQFFDFTEGRILTLDY